MQFHTLHFYLWLLIFFFFLLRFFHYFVKKIVTTSTCILKYYPKTLLKRFEFLFYSLLIKKKNSIYREGDCFSKLQLNLCCNYFCSSEATSAKLGTKICTRAMQNSQLSSNCSRRHAASTDQLLVTSARKKVW